MKYYFVHININLPDGQRIGTRYGLFEADFGEACFDIYDRIVLDAAKTHGVNKSDVEVTQFNKVD